MNIDCYFYFFSIFYFKYLILKHFTFLRECPFALEASEGLLSLGVKGAEVASLMLSGSISVANIDW